jgi:hypothetical protein
MFVHFHTQNQVRVGLKVKNIRPINYRLLSELFRQSLFRGCSTVTYHRPEETGFGYRKDLSVTSAENIKVYFGAQFIS